MLVVIQSAVLHLGILIFWQAISSEQNCFVNTGHWNKSHSWNQPVEKEIRYILCQKLKWLFSWFLVHNKLSQPRFTFLRWISRYWYFCSCFQPPNVFWWPYNPLTETTSYPEKKSILIVVAAYLVSLSFLIEVFFNLVV